MTEKPLVEEVINFESPDIALALFGPQNNHLQVIEDDLGVQLSSRGNQLEIKGSEDQVSQVTAIFENLLALLREKIPVKRQDVISALQMSKDGNLDQFLKIYQKEIVTDHHGEVIRTKNVGQYRYVKAVAKNDIVFGIGPAGTGKTFLAVAMAVAALRKGEIKRIVLTRPAVEAGENLGFLPGDLKEKVDPYLRPIYDALNQIFGTAHTQRLIERGVIEIAPLAYMRGRTLNDAFIILDEAQNTTPAQMKMFLTRLGFGSKMIINGDTSQIDLGPRAKSGLVEAQRVLRKVNGVEIISFTSSDVVRHPLVARIIEAYDTSERQKKTEE